MDDKITATNVVAGQKVGWALGSMLYEINTLPWKYIPRDEVHDYNQIVGRKQFLYHFLGALLVLVSAGLLFINRARQHRRRMIRQAKSQYSSVEDIELENDNH